MVFFSFIVSASDDIVSTLIEQSLVGGAALLQLQTERRRSLDQVRKDHFAQYKERAFESLDYFKEVDAKFVEFTVHSKQVEETDRRQSVSVEPLKKLVEQAQVIARAGKCELKEVAVAMFPLLDALIAPLSDGAFSVEASELAKILTKHIMDPIRTLLESNWLALFSSSAQDVVASSDTCVREKLRLDASRQLPDYVPADVTVWLRCSFFCDVSVWFCVQMCLCVVIYAHRRLRF